MIKNFNKFVINKISNKSIFNNFNKFNFSTSTSKSSSEEEVHFETKEEKDLRYEDESFYFEREWKKLQNDKLQKHQDYISPDISEHQQKECDILIDRLLQLSMMERQYFELALKESFEKSSGVEFGKPNIFDLKNIPKISLSRDSDNPNWENSQKILESLTPFIASGYFVGGGAQVAAAAVDIKQVKKEKEPEVVTIKAKVDIKIASFDAAKKIALIKEVRALLGLGLKEAKDMVEKAPVVIKKDIPRAEAEEIEKKLKENGATIELV